MFAYYCFKKKVKFQSHPYTYVLIDVFNVSISFYIIFAFFLHLFLAQSILKSIAISELTYV